MVSWPSLEVREGFLEEVTTEWRLRGQWSQSEVLFQQGQSLDRLEKSKLRTL